MPKYLLAALLELAPDYRAARKEYAEVLIEVHKHQEARQQLERLMAGSAAGALLQTLYANTAVGLGSNRRRSSFTSELLAGNARTDADLHLSIAHAFKTLGQQKEAISEYRKAAECRPSFGDAYWSLANLKTYRFTDAELARLRNSRRPIPVTTVDRYHVCFRTRQGARGPRRIRRGFSLLRARQCREAH
jgi:tetratricopeptide (TPR) repeat protein